MHSKLDKFVRLYGMPVGLLALVLLLQVAFIKVPLFSALNIKNILLETVSIAMTALGLSYIMMSGEGDLSFAGVFSLLTVVFAMVSNISNNFFVAFVAVLGIALVVNMTIALLVTRLKFSSFIVSIALMFMANGVEKALHQQTTLINNPNIVAFARVGFGLPLIVWLLVVVYLVSYIVVNKTKFGFSLRIVGENNNAAIEAGINSKAMEERVFMNIPV